MMEQQRNYKEKMNNPFSGTSSLYAAWRTRIQILPLMAMYSDTWTLCTDGDRFSWEF